jgi:hypothetical protein
MRRAPAMVRVHSDGVGGRRVIRWACSWQSPAPQQAQQAIAVLVELALAIVHSKQFIVNSSRCLRLLKRISTRTGKAAVG